MRNVSVGRDSLESVPFRNPIYLDGDLLSNLADYFGVSAPDETQVTSRATTGAEKGAGIDKVLTAKVGATKSHELTESYSLTMRPVRLMNDLVDLMTERSELVDLDADPEATVVAGSVVQISGTLQLAATNEVGSIMSRFLPLLMAQATAGKTEFEPPTQAEIARLLLAPADDESGPQLFELEPETPLEGRRHLAIVDAACLRGTASTDDIEGDFTLVAHVDRLVRPRIELSLNQYLLPGLPRTVRRALGRTDLTEMVTGLGPVLGRDIAASDLQVVGPALMLKPLAIF